MQFIELGKQYQQYQEEINQAIQQVLSSNQFVLGENVECFETELSDYLGVPYVVSCSSGTDALQLSLMSLGIKAGDEVVTTAFTFIATAQVISILGAKPVFCDIAADTFNIDTAILEEKITPNTKVIIPVSLFGQPADMDAINALAEAKSQEYGHEIVVIEDAAQSLGAQYKQKFSGNLSTLACTSFFPAKPLGCYGDGGAVMTNDESLAQKIKSLRIHGQTERYHHASIGINGRLDAIQAAILRAKLKHFPEEVEKRQFLAAAYSEGINKDDYQVPVIKRECTSVYAQYTLRSPNRAKVINTLAEHGIPTAIHYPTPLHLQPCFADLGYSVGDFPVAEKAASEVFSLPMSPFLAEDDQQQIINVLNKIG